MSSLAPPTDRLPREIKAIIASFLPGQSASLASASLAWQDVTEEYIWRSIKKQRHLVFASHRLSRQDIQDAFERIRDDWVFLLSALERRPVRQRYVRSIMSCGSLSAVSEMTAIFRLCASQLELLSQLGWDSGNTHDLEASAFALAVNAARTLPGIKHLALEVEGDWEVDVISALRSTPSIEYLSLGSPYSFREGDGTILDIANPPLHLTKLRTIEVECDGWAVGVEAIVAGAPHLQTLKLMRHWIGPEAMTMQAGERILSHPSLRNLQVDGTTNSEWFLAGLRRNNAALAKNVKTLSIDIGLVPGRFPRLDNLEFFAIRHGPGIEQTHFIATRPSRQMTGLIGAWFVDALKGMPRLKALGIGDELHDYQSVLVRTYTDGTRTLYHLRHSPSPHPVAELLGTHHLAYVRRDLSFYPGRQRHLTWDPHDDATLLKLGAEEPDVWVDSTSYRGLAIPTAMLAYIHASRNEDGTWVTGTRDLPLPEAVWKALDAWADEVESSVDWASLKAEDLNAIDYDDLLRGVWDPATDSYIQM